MCLSLQLSPELGPGGTLCTGGVPCTPCPPSGGGAGGGPMYVMAQPPEGFAYAGGGGMQPQFASYPPAPGTPAYPATGGPEVLPPQSAAYPGAGGQAYPSAGAAYPPAASQAYPPVYAAADGLRAPSYVQAQHAAAAAPYPPASASASTVGGGTAAAAAAPLASFMALGAGASSEFGDDGAYGGGRAGWGVAAGASGMQG